VSFGTTAPANPVRGHFWWNGTTLFMFDGAVWVPTGGSGASGSTPPSTTAPANPTPGQQWFNGTTLFVWDGNAWVPVSQTKTYVQATAPPSPNPGDMWWNGTTMYVWSGSAWMVVGPGATAGPTPTTKQTFAISSGGPTSIALNQWVAFPWSQAPTINTDGTVAWDPIQHKLTPQKAGYYYASAYSYCDPATGGQADWSQNAIVKNDPGTYAGTAITVATALFYNTQGAAALTANNIVYMNGTTDYLRYWRYESLTGVSPIDTLALFILP